MKLSKFDRALLVIVFILLLHALPLLISGEVTLSDVYGSLEQYQQSIGR